MHTNVSGIRNLRIPNTLVMQLNAAVHTSGLDTAICTDFFPDVESQDVPMGAVF